MPTVEDAIRIGLAFTVAVESTFHIRPYRSDDTKRNEAMALAMGILHGCCGPNGDFTGDYRGARKSVEIKDE